MFGLAAKKSLGQHFLLDLNITRKIVRIGGICAGDHVYRDWPRPGRPHPRAVGDRSARNRH